MFFSRVAFLFLLLTLVVPCGSWGAKDLAANRQELKQIKERIDTLSATLKKGQKEKGALQKDLDGLQKQLTLLLSREKQAVSSLKSIQADITATEKEVSVIQAQTRQRRELVARRLGAIYRGDQMRLLRILFSNRSPAAIAEDYHLFKRVVQHDRALLDSYRQDQQQLTERLASLESLKQQSRQQMDHLQASRETLQKGRQLKTRLLTQLKRKEGSMAEELAGLKEKSKRLAALVKKLESTPTPKYTQPSGSFAQQKGKLPWPLNGRIKIPFGSGRLADLGTLYDSQGIEITVSGNQAIHASWGGTVIYANAFRGYGNMIIVDHGDNFYTLYAQASRLQKRVGDTVKPGDLIAYPGYENADSIYFEIRHRGTPLDPLAWLKPRS